MLIEGAAFDRCTACSQSIIDAYRQRGFELLRKVFNESNYLEKLTGLDKLHAEAEAAMEDVEWDEDEAEGAGDDF